MRKPISLYTQDKSILPILLSGTPRKTLCSIHPMTTILIIPPTSSFLVPTTLVVPMPNSTSHQAPPQLCSSHVNRRSRARRLVIMVMNLRWVLVLLLMHTMGTTTVEVLPRAIGSKQCRRALNFMHINCSTKCLVR